MPGKIMMLLNAFCFAAFAAPSGSAAPAKEAEGAIITKMPPLTTKRPYLPRRQSGYAFTSNIEQIAYVSEKQSSMIHFAPVNPSHKPELLIALPRAIKLQGAFRDIGITGPEPYALDGKEFDLYRATPGPRASKYTFFWRAESALADGAELEGFYWGEWAKGKQKPQKLAIRAVAIPEAASFKKMPVFLSMPNDFFAQFPDTAGFRRGGFNTLDFWTYLSAKERSWGESLLNAALSKTKKAGIGESAWIQEWWWHRGRGEPDGMATLIDGSTTDSMLCLSYRGKWYQALIEQGKYLIDRGLYFHSTDPEMYGRGNTICFCGRCKARFREYLEKKGAPAYADPSVFEKEPEKHAELHREWCAFKCRSYTAFFADYRGAMEAYMKEKGIDAPFRFMIYSSYHRSFPGFSEYPDYTRSHSYLMTLEDPKTFIGVFDYVAPMVYMDVYANYKDYDMLLPAKDTAVLRKITEDRVPITPILCTGYPFAYAFGSDLNAEMLKYNMLEVIGAGGKGFGFWGECPFDAADAKAVAEVVKMLGPYENIILNGKADAEISAVSKNAVVKRVRSAEGSIVLVSEYSRRPLTVEIDCPVETPSRVVELSTGKEIASVAPGKSRFHMKLEKERAAALYVGR